MRRNRFAKIVATLGLTSSDSEVVKRLFIEGVDIFRLNFSHGTHEQHAKNIQTIRRIEQEIGRPIAILQDLQGPKFRVGRFNGGKVALTIGQKFIFDRDENLGDNRRVFLPHPEIFKAVKAGDKLLVDDARVSFKVISNDGHTIETEHVYGKFISDNKGVNLPDTMLSVPVLTEKDEKDLAFGLKQGVDFVALSFVQRGSDMVFLRKKAGSRASILAKIEKPAAIENIEDILRAGDAIMVARGDLGVEFPPEKLPSLQKRLIEKARRIGKPVIVATQMLESMIDSPVPTRAEATDVDTAISLGADAVMLSGETAVGKYPVETVAFMNRMIIEAEKDWHYRHSMQTSDPCVVHSSEGAISQGVKAIVNSIPIAAIACFTTSGGTAIRIGRERALTPLLAMTPNIDSARRLQLYWGIDAGVMIDMGRFRTVIAAATATVRHKGYAKDGEWIIVTVGVPFGKAGTTNTLRLAKIGQDDFDSIK